MSEANRTPTADGSNGNIEKQGVEGGMAPILQLVAAAQRRFRSELVKLLEDGGLTRERYVRYLSMQYHMTKGVQRPFLTIAAHPDLSRRRELRKFICNFANEEEFHYAVAARDLEQLGEKILPIPFDVELWWAYFDKIVVDRPFVRLGATAVLENLGPGSREEVAALFGRANYLTPKNTVFLRIHQHDETIPHGDQIIAALSSTRFDAQHYADLREGAQKGTILYLRMAAWAFYGDAVYEL